MEDLPVKFRTQVIILVTMQISKASRTGSNLESLESGGNKEL